MRYRNLGKSGLKVSEIGLGCNSFGMRIDEQSSISIINHALDMGINFLDTSDLYGHGQSEEFIGKALKGKRYDVILATKFGINVSARHGATDINPNEGGGSRYYIIKAFEASLRRLSTDYIDLYQVHVPDPDTPIEETLRALDDLVRAGKVRYIGCSNFSAWRLNDALWTSKVCYLESFVTLQTEYSLLYRNIEQDIVPCCQHNSIGVIPWSPLAGGFLTGKYHAGEPAPAGSRIADMPQTGEFVWNDVNFEVVANLDKFATQHGYKVGELAIAWLLSHPWISTVIAGATKTEQLSANIASAEWKLSAEEIAEVDSISAICLNSKGYGDTLRK